ncbi:hypothetical protein PR048_007361 [Dryococelus australis]|uniref:DUF4371 domain-containing protein n=1 Tax=Dryococelus australis TaxID=614101 RepID=A0ABQ9HU15_9NEOP|nr:hypothetical protein PR048_007361 [Dryococelus australis]
MQTKEGAYFIPFKNNMWGINQFVNEVKSYKYYSISLDSTPDIVHVDQLTLTIHYVLPSGPVERFVKFLAMKSHSAEQLISSLMDFFKGKQHRCRGQSYEHYSNMSGKYSGLQAQIKELNEFAVYIPCFAHSRNLIGKHAAECCQEAVIFFDFLESLYTFFPASSYRWSLLSFALSDDGAHFPNVKRLSDTRWSPRADARKALL